MYVANSMRAHKFNWPSMIAHGGAHWQPYLTGGDLPGFVISCLELVVCTNLKAWFVSWTVFCVHSLYWQLVIDRPVQEVSGTQ